MVDMGQAIVTCDRRTITQGRHDFSSATLLQMPAPPPYQNDIGPESAAIWIPKLAMIRIERMTGRSRPKNVSIILKLALDITLAVPSDIPLRRRSKGSGWSVRLAGPTLSQMR
jgi:hypothetical protein